VLDADKCRECGRPLIEIESPSTSSRRLICNEWRDSNGNPVKLSAEDVVALHALRRN
jgi:hypothetical protein